jgi:hypothetical protein
MLYCTGYSCKESLDEEDIDAFIGDAFARRYGHRAR